MVVLVLCCVRVGSVLCCGRLCWYALWRGVCCVLLWFVVSVLCGVDLWCVVLRCCVVL